MKTLHQHFGLLAITLTFAADLLTASAQPVIVTQPNPVTAVVGNSVTFSVSAHGPLNSLAQRPAVSSGQLRLWLKADTGVITNAAGQVSVWQDQSGNANDAAQTNTVTQPELTAASSLNGAPVLRFNGIEDGVHGTFLHGGGDVNLTNAMTSFAVYNVFSSETTSFIWLVGQPPSFGAAVAMPFIRGKQIFRPGVSATFRRS